MRGFILFLAAIFLAVMPIWAQQISITGQYTLSGNYRITPAVVLLFEEDFEDGTKDAWDVDTWPSDVTVTTTNPKYGTYHLRAHYACTYSGSTCSINRWLGKTGFTQDHLFIQFWYSVHVNAGGSVEGVQRKVVWGDDGVGPSYDWSFILNNWYGTPTGYMYLAMTANVGPGCTPWQDWNLAQLSYDTYYLIEVEWELESSPGADDASYKLYVDGGLEASGSGKCVRGTDTSSFSLLRFGVQAQADDDLDEEHDFDNVKVAGSYIGP